MQLKSFIAIIMIAAAITASGQGSQELNRTDSQGRKQGHWIKRYPNNSVMYDATFRDDHPVGEFRRYFEDGSLKSVLVFSNDGKKAEATLYWPNGYVSSKGVYLNQKKEGTWKFYSVLMKDCPVAEENYKADRRNGLSIWYYADSTVAEKVNWVDGIRNGEWTKFYSGGAKCLKSSYTNDKINGRFEVWFENGKPQFSGQYKNDVRDGLWLIYDSNGNLKYQLEYSDGIANNRQMDIDESDYLDKLEKNAGMIADPEKQQ